MVNTDITLSFLVLTLLTEYDDQPCLLIFRDEDETNALLSLKDPISLLKDLEPTSYPTPRDKLIVDTVLEKRQTCRIEPDGKHMNTEHIDVPPDFSDVQLAEVFIHHRVPHRSHHRRRSGRRRPHATWPGIRRARGRPYYRYLSGRLDSRRPA